MKAITFLGTGNYQTVTYEWNQQKVETNLFPVALTRFFDPDVLLVVTTPAAGEKWSRSLEDQIASSTELHPIDIPDGHSEAELWDIFTRITEHLVEGDEVIFDITHSFRTLPFLSFLAAAYLKTARRVKLRGVYYGAYDARVPLSDEPTAVAPVFDLTPFVELLDWSTATEEFLHTMDARKLGGLLEGRHRRARAAGLDASLQPAARALAKASRTVELAQPGRLMEEAPKLLDKLERARADIQKHAPPFGVLLDRVIEGYRPFSVENPDPQLDVKIQWRALLGYFRREQVVQAATLAREWLVSLLCWQMGEPMHVRTDRERLERALNAYIDHRSCAAPEELRLKDALPHVPQIDKIGAAWSIIRDLRNKIAHCGMSAGDTPPETMAQNVLELRAPLQTIVAGFDLTDC